MNPVAVADVSRIEAHLRNTRLDRLQGEDMVEVNVRHNRDRRLPHDSGHGIGRFPVVHGDPDNVTSRLGGAHDLRHGSAHIGGLRLGHGLHGNRRSAADLHSADRDLTCLPPYSDAVGRAWIARGFLRQVEYRYLHHIIPQWIFLLASVRIRFSSSVRLW